jgi:hypothetical protein
MHKLTSEKKLEPIQWVIKEHSIKHKKIFDYLRNISFIHFYYFISLSGGEEHDILIFH